MEKQALVVWEQQWYQMITAAKQSGQSIKSWCAENGVPLSGFYSLQRKMRTTLLQKTDALQFGELSADSPKMVTDIPAQVVVHIRDISVELSAGLSSAQISEIIRGVRNAV